MSDVQEADWVEKIGKPAYESIAEMVAALDCDYDRLEELREERKELAEALQEAQDADPYEERELNDTAGERAAELIKWDEDNAEELKELEAAAGECKDRDEARQRIEEDALSVEVRSDWVALGEEMTAEEFNILLTTGGPAVRIMGELSDGEPHRAWLEVQDWGKLWTQYFPAKADVLLSYARCFYFGT